MTQRQKVLQMLRAAGSKGVRSDEFFAAYLPRAGARIHELKAEGYEITSEPEKQYRRYRLESVGSETGGPRIMVEGKAEAASLRSGTSSGEPRNTSDDDSSCFSAKPGEDARLFELEPESSAWTRRPEAA
jgi:hypothetical protein